MNYEYRPTPLVPALDFANRQIPAHGSMGVDYEQRVDFGRLRDYRLDRAMKALEASEWLEGLPGNVSAEAFT